MEAHPRHKEQMVIGVDERLVLLPSSLPPQFWRWKKHVHPTLMNKRAELYDGDGGRVSGQLCE
jgi:hypothetical protein